jgi:uncharacterized protein (TIGR02271 family)
MMSTNDLQNMIGRNAVDSNGDKIGKIAQVYLDDQTDEPRWVTVNTGLFGTKESFAPLSGSRWDGDDLMLAVTKDQVKGAPNLDADGHLQDSENEELYDYYGTSGQSAGYVDGDSYDRGTGSDGYTRGEGRDTSGPNTDDAMTRSEERVDVGTKQVEAGRARLRKYVVTENVTTTVPVSREEARIEREPITDANRGDALSGGDITEEEHEVTLRAEQPVVQKEAVPVERVRLTTDTVTEDQEITEQVRKEQIDGPDVDSQRDVDGRR